MKRFLLSTTVSSLVLGVLVLGVAPQIQALDVLSPGDPILAIDFDGVSGSASPGAEGPGNVLDGNSATKYLNFGVTDTGFIVTPTASSIVHSFTLTTANDAVERDPASWEIYGTNDPITSTNHSNGSAENWSLIGSGALALPDIRLTLGPTVSFANSTAYSSYRMIFPTLKNAAAANSMQIADVGFFASSNGTGANILTGATNILAVRIGELISQSDYPGGQSPVQALDRDTATKYLNFGKEDSGFIVTPSAGATAVNGFQITTANDFPVRDPASWELYGSNDPVTSEDNSFGDGENWTLVDSGALALPAERFTAGAVVAVDNTTTYSSYRMVFPTLKDTAGAGADSIQYSEIQLFAPGVDARLEVDRATGELTIFADENATFSSYRVESTTSGALDDSAWTSIAGTADQDSGGGGALDPDDIWNEVSLAGDPNSLEEEDGPGGANNGATIAAGNSFSLGDVWLRTPVEDIVFQLRNADGGTIAAEVTYVGAEIVPGDYNNDGVVNAGDWPLFRAGLGAASGDLSPAQAYLLGDLDGDLDSDLDDFNQFVGLAGGAAALFGGGAVVPEPSTLALLSGAGVALLLFRRRRLQAGKGMALLVLGMACAASSANAQTFTNLGTPVTVTTPDPLENAESGPANLFDDTFLDNSPGEFNAQLFNADYAGEFVGDLLQYAGAGPAPKTVFMDFGSSINTNWFAYAQRDGGNPLADRIGKFEFWFSNTDFGGLLPGTNPDSVLELSPDDPRVSDSIFRPYPLFGEQSGRFAAVRFTISELSEDQPTNNIGGNEFRFLSGPSDIVVEVDRASGSMTMRNNGAIAQAIDIKAYEIRSDSGALEASGFNGIRGDSGAFPAGDGTGNGWEIGGGSGANALIEAYFSGASSLAAGVSSLPLGTAYNPLTVSEDLTFRYTNSLGQVYDGRVDYVGIAPDVLSGDYNDNGVVDAADYAVWRDNLGSNAILPSDPTPGVVNQSDYDRWVANFGDTAPGSGSSANAVPEPTALGLASLVLAIVGAVGARRQWR